MVNVDLRRALSPNPQRIIIPAVRQVVKYPRLAEYAFGWDRWGNPFSDERYSDPFPMLTRMQAEDGPITYRAFYQQWFVFGHEEAQILLNDPRVSTETQIANLFDVRPYNKLSPRTETFFRNWLLVRDAPDHTRLRRLVSGAFTRRTITALEPTIEAVTAELMAGLVGRRRFDVVADFASRLPTTVIADLLGLPPERRDWLHRIAGTISVFLDVMESWDPADLDRAVDELYDYLPDLAAERRLHPRDDLITALAQVEDDDGGTRLTTDELVATVGLLIFAGHDTTMSQIGNALLALARNPDQRSLIWSQPELWSNAVEELLRYDSAVTLTQRHTVDDIEIADRTIPAGSDLIVMVNIANRDPRRYDDPGSLRLDRDDPRPLSFGHGAHHCLGHALARAELRIGLSALLEDLCNYWVDEDSIEWRRSLALRGPVKMVVERG